MHSLDHAPRYQSRLAPLRHRPAPPYVRGGSLSVSPFRLIHGRRATPSTSGNTSARVRKSQNPIGPTYCTTSLWGRQIAPADGAQGDRPQSRNSPSTSALARSGRVTHETPKHPLLPSCSFSHLSHSQRASETAPPPQPPPRGKSAPPPPAISGGKNHRAMIPKRSDRLLQFLPTRLPRKRRLMLSDVDLLFYGPTEDKRDDADQAHRHVVCSQV